MYRASERGGGDAERSGVRERTPITRCIGVSGLEPRNTNQNDVIPRYARNDKRPVASHQPRDKGHTLLGYC